MTNEEILEMLEDLEFQQCSFCEWARCPSCGAQAPAVDSVSAATIKRAYKYGSRDADGSHHKSCELKNAMEELRARGSTP